MDPLTHVVVGRAVVAAARDETRNHLIGAAAILGALSPDVDSVLAFSGWDRYVRAHQYGTHSLLGAMTTALVAAIVVDRSAEAFALRRAVDRSADTSAIRRAVDRSADAFGLRRDVDRSASTSALRIAAADRRSAKASAERFPALFRAAAAGALSHIALDLISGARIAILWPLDANRGSLPLVAMADPWLVAMCLVWLLMLWPARVRLRTASRALLSAAAIFLCFKAALLSLALRHPDHAPAEPSALEARWGSLTHWFIFERAQNAVRTSAIASDGPPIVVMTRRLGPESPLVRASRSLDDVRNFLAVHEFAFPAETTDGDGRASVMWSDLRYCSPSGCGVWVGGTFDANGKALTQEVRVGTVVQRRSP